MDNALHHRHYARRMLVLGEVTGGDSVSLGLSDGDSVSLDPLGVRAQEQKQVPMCTKSFGTRV